MSAILNSINWTTVIASTVTAVIIGAAQFITARYLGRTLDRLERRYNKDAVKK